MEKILLKCMNCGADFERPASVVNSCSRRGIKRHYCCFKCAREANYNRSIFSISKPRDLWT